MSNSQSLSETNQTDLTHRRAFRLLVFLGLAGIVSGIVFPLLSETEFPPITFVTSYGSGVVHLIGAYLIYKKRQIWGIAVSAAMAPIIAVIVIAQNMGIGFMVVVSLLLIYMMLFPLVLTEKDYLSRIQIGAVIGAAVLIFADLYWPFPRATVAPELVRATLIFLLALVIVFAAIIIGRFSSFTLRGKVISATLLVTTIAIAAVAFGVNSFTRNALTQEGGRKLQALSHSQGLLIGELLAREVTSLQSLTLDDSLLAALESQNASYTGSNAEIEIELLEKDSNWTRASSTHPAVTAILQNPISEKMRQFSAIFPENGNMLLTDRYGALVAATGVTDRYYLADEAWWEGAYNVGFGKTYISDPGLNERSGIGFLQIALPVFSNQSVGPSRLLGILYARYSLKSLEDLMVASQAGETQSIKIHLPGYQLSLDEDHSLQVISDEIISDDVLMGIQEADDGYAFITFSGVSHLFSVTPINTLNHQPIVDDLNWLVSVQQAESEALASVAQQQRLNILMGMFMVLIAGSIAAYIGTKLTEPILRLTTVAEEVSAGNLDARAEVSTRDEIGTLATVFNSMTAQVSESITTLEHRVADRTRSQDTLIQISRHLSTILDRQELVQAVVQQVREAFDYYHAQIYLFDSHAQNLIMVGGTGKAGQQMLANGHQIPAGKGLVGQAGQTRQPVLVVDTSKAKDWLPNPLLPDTKSEVAVPIISGNTVWGVLDVQHKTTGGFGQADVALLESIANQVAVALRNANLFEEAQQQAKREAMMNEINQKILSTKDVHEAMRVAVREIGRATGASSTSVRLAFADSQDGNSEENGRGQTNGN